MSKIEQHIEDFATKELNMLYPPSLLKILTNVENLTNKEVLQLIKTAHINGTKSGYYYRLGEEFSPDSN